ncbi:uncharacterized protein LOC122380753 [Amphibalanus amphitrite]|uniref:uncharacterized protein LOC122380753 n=1 Tax=Amphibalanus amphitrite TaxID=1232801 RepID=UPI001C908DA6|nr:uncharacterized protein LOC122380753 [Amphibalanus amphitrite]XP_043220102.1 uncharacterized protein LOC122380753 [Amphibalanus amphitrite]
MSALKNERAMKKGALTRTRRRAFVLIDTRGSKRELHAVLKELDNALQDVLEKNMEYKMSSEDDDHQKKCDEYEQEATEEHRIAQERVASHLQERAGETPSATTDRSSAASKARVQHTTRMAEVEDKVRELELQQLQRRLEREEEEQKMQRARQLQEKQDALQAARLKTELTKAAESELTWDRKEDFNEENERRPEGNQKRDEEHRTDLPVPNPNLDSASQLFRQSLPRLRLPTFSGAVEEFPRWYSIFSTLVEQQNLSANEKMAHLQNAVTGAARAIIGGMVCDGSSFEDALQALKERYGRDIDVVQMTLKTVFSCPAPKPFDARSLERYYGAVHGATTTLKRLGYEGDLQSCENLRRLLSKLPVDMRKAWAEHSLGMVRPTLLEFDQWLRLQLRIQLSCEAAAPAPSQQKRTAGMFLTTKTASTSGEKRCVLCGESHGLWACEQFKALTADERARVVAEHRLCFSCLRPGHRSRDCRTARACGIDGCVLRHSRYLHGSRRIRRLQPGSPPPSGTETTTGEITIASVRREEQDACHVLLQVVPVRVHGPAGQYKDTLALLDPGAQTSLCNASVLDELQVEGEVQPVRLSNVEAAGRERLSRRTTLELSPLASTEDPSKRILVPEIFSVDRVNVRTPTIRGKNVSKFKHLEGLKIPDISSGTVEVLLGANVLEAVLQREARVGAPGEPVAIRTAFGWSLTGSLTGVVPEHVREAMFVSTLRGQEQHDLSDWWTTESFGTRATEPALTPDEKRAMDILEKTTQHRGDKYEVGLLWRDEEAELPDNYTMAHSRLRSLERNLAKNPERAQAYREVLEGYVQQGYARKLTAEESRVKKKKRWILPHHAVTHPEKVKPRVVFDAAAQFQGTSLNSELLKGPDLLQNLHGVLLRFRQERYALVADVFQMFHQIQVRATDQPALSFLWREMQTSRPPDIYQMLVVIFGAKCSPCIANYILRRTLVEDKEAERQGGHPTLLANFYVDDFLRAEETPEAALATMEKVTALMSRGGFRLTKWRSSHPELLESIPEDDRDASQKQLVSCEGGTRKALVRTASGSYKRPCTKICLLEGEAPLS